jgi:hypothetical protein
MFLKLASVRVCLALLLQAFYQKRDFLQSRYFADFKGKELLFELFEAE